MRKRRDDDDDDDAKAALLARVESWLPIGISSSMFRPSPWASGRVLDDETPPLRQLQRRLWEPHPRQSLIPKSSDAKDILLPISLGAQQCQSSVRGGLTRSLLFLVPPMLDPPLPDAVINHIPRNATINQLHHHTQRLHILIPALVVEKQHLLVRQPGGFVQVCEMSLLVSGEDLQVVKGEERLW